MHTNCILKSFRKESEFPLYQAAMRQKPEGRSAGGRNGLCLLISVWKLWCRIVSVCGKGEDNISFYLTWPYTAPQGKTLNLEHIEQQLNSKATIFFLKISPVLKASGHFLSLVTNWSILNESGITGKVIVLDSDTVIFEIWASSVIMMLTIRLVHVQLAVMTQDLQETQVHIK